MSGIGQPCGCQLPIPWSPCLHLCPLQSTSYPVVRWIWKSKSYQTLTWNSPLVFHNKQKKTSLRWPPRSCIMAPWSLISFHTFSASSIILQPVQPHFVFLKNSLSREFALRYSPPGSSSHCQLFLVLHYPLKCHFLERPALVPILKWLPRWRLLCKCSLPAL